MAIVVMPLMASASCSYLVINKIRGNRTAILAMSSGLTNNFLYKFKNFL